MGRDWGRIVVGTRLEKNVPDDFFMVWSNLITFGLRPGDGWMIASKKVAHKAANCLVKRFLMETQAETLCLLDSDADVDTQFLEEMRTYEPGKEYDVLQAFYTTRGWPPLPVWFDKAPDGRFRRTFVTDPDYTGDVVLCGNHATLFRREIFVKQMEAQPEIPIGKFDWFWYPRHNKNAEDTAFSVEASSLGFRLGATTHVKTGHISQVTTGWKTMLEWLEKNMDKLQDAEELSADGIAKS
jgi:hypothetical protein